MSERARYPRRAALALLGGAALAGCGFTPVYAPGQAGARLRGALALREPVSRADYILAARVEERLGLASAAPYRLGYTITQTTEDQAITADQAIQRIGLQGMLDYTVTDTVAGRTLVSGRIMDFTGYNTTGTTVATRTAERDAERRLMVMLADRLVEELAVTGADWLP